MERSPLKGLLLVVVAAASWGTTGTTLKLVGATSTSDALVIGTIRMAIAGPTLMAVVLIRRERLVWVRGSFVTAGVCMAAYQLCYFSAVPLAGVAATALLAICSAPILVAVLAHLVLNEHLSRTRLLALGVGIAGAALLLAGAGPAAGTNFGLGAVLALGAGLSYSIYAVVSKSALPKTEPLALSGMTFGVAAMGLAPILAIRWTDSLSLIIRGGPLLLYLGIVATALAYWLYTTGLRCIPASTAVLAGLIEPLTATFLGVLLFRERLDAAGAIGSVLLIAAVVMLGLPQTHDLMLADEPKPQGMNSSSG